MDPRRQSFTIIEVMVSIAIGLALSILATSIFLNVQRVIQRAKARLEMHNSARFFFMSMRQDLIALEQEGALFIETQADSQPTLPAGDARHTGEVRLTFLSGRLDNYDFDYFKDGTPFNTDLVWKQWTWRQHQRTVSTGANAPWRSFAMSVPWIGPDGHDYGSGHTYATMPQPRRVAGSDAATTLEDNRWRTDGLDPMDFGDYTDLSRQTSMITHNVCDFKMEVILDDGSVLDADATSTQTLHFDGNFVDGRVPSASPPSHKRPRLLRVHFTMLDPETTLRQDFAFSFAAPGLLPPL